VNLNKIYIYIKKLEKKKKKKKKKREKERKRIGVAHEVTPKGMAAQLASTPILFSSLFFLFSFINVYIFLIYLYFFVRVTHVIILLCHHFYSI
jgi:membrane protein insertase Oxa1/YidC/SpoIIIJ